MKLTVVLENFNGQSAEGLYFTLLWLGNLKRSDRLFGRLTCAPATTRFAFLTTIKNPTFSSQ